jgi:hypothetical protein
MTQIKIYATLVLLSFLSVKALATDATTEASPAEPALEMEVAYVDDLMVESWMVDPFKVYADQKSFNEIDYFAIDKSFTEPELEVENWMTIPFYASDSEMQADNNYGEENLQN